MTIQGQVEIRPLREDDPPIIAAACQREGWGKTEAQYRRYLRQQADGHRSCLVATVDAEFAGYVTVNWRPSYPGSVQSKIPEIQDLNVLPQFRRRGIGSRLLDEAEALVASRFDWVAIGVGLHPGYNGAQRLYVKRGYVPDGRGVTYRDRYVEEGATIKLDDDFVLHFTKRLKGEPSSRR